MPDFSTPALHAIEQAVDLDDQAASSSRTLPLYDAYEMDSTVEEILKHGYKTVALQFPDELLGDSVKVYRGLMRGLRDKEWDGQCYVLGDSTYGSCCPDILSCAHLPADYLVHYGHACLTPTDALPVRYIFPKQPLDVADCTAQLLRTAFPPPSVKGKEKETRHVLLVWDVAYDWVADDLARSMHEAVASLDGCDVRIIPSRMNKQAAHSQRRQGAERSTTQDGSTPQEPAGCACSTPASGGCCGGAGGDGLQGDGPGAEPIAPQQSSCACRHTQPAQTDLAAKSADLFEQHPDEAAPSLRTWELPEGVQERDCVIFYVGEESKGLVNFMMEHAGNELYQYDPSRRTVSALHARAPALLRKRFFTLQRALQASVFGLLVHNVGLASSSTLLRDLKTALRARDKKFYTVSVGRLNPAKLGNFEVVECWVLIGCREGGMVDGKEYYRPIITPYELMLALDGERGVAKWSQDDWTLDFRRVLSGLATAEEERKELDGDDSSGDDEPVFSLADGKYHQTTRTRRGKKESQGDGGEGAVVLRDGDMRLEKASAFKAMSAAGAQLANRSYQGLDASEGYGAEPGAYEPAKLEQGRAGIARGYGEEDVHK